MLLVLKEPAAHATQVDIPETEEVPAAQERQAVVPKPSANVPATHTAKK
jgi:hypothetical protein